MQRWKVVAAAVVAGALVAGAQLAGPVGQETAQHPVFDQDGALRRHAFVVHRQRTKGAVAEAFVDGGDGFVGDRFTHPLGEGQIGRAHV